MEKEEYRDIKNSIGMFDLLKGMGMIIVVLGHTINTYDFNIMKENNIVILSLGSIVAIIGEIIIPMFFMVSGYGFRKRPVKKCIQQQATLMLKPYLYVMVVTVTLHLCIHYAVFCYLPSAIKESLKILGGFVLALPENMKIFGINFFSCGAIWYIIALFLGWVILDWLMVTISEKYWNLCIMLVMSFGWLISLKNNTPFCLSQGLIAAGYLYSGYKIKKSKALFTKFTWAKWVVITVTLFINTVIIVAKGQVNNMADATWTLGPVSILFDAILAYAMLYCTLSLNKFDNTIIDGVKIIGRNSLIIFSVHTVEMVAVPWYLILPQIHSIIRCIIIFAMRSVVIFVVCFIINKRKYIFNSLK